MAKPASSDLEPWHKLNGKVVLVTGASSGLGREFCLDLAKAGCKIVAAARRMDRLKSLCDQINANNFTSPSPSMAVSKAGNNSTNAVAIKLDVTADGRTIEAAVQNAWDSFGHIDALVNNAGIRGGIKSSLDLSEEEWNAVIRTNLTGPWLVSRFIGIRMRGAGRGGSIINISSVSGLNRTQFQGSVAYSSSKAAMDSMTKIMAMELGAHKICVNSIAPGLFESEITKDLVQKDWLKNVALRSVPLKTFGTSDPALTTLVRYLIHESSRYVSGNVFIADAGYTLPGVPIFSSL